MPEEPDPTDADRQAGVQRKTRAVARSGGRRRPLLIAGAVVALGLAGVVMWRIKRLPLASPPAAQVQAPESAVAASPPVAAPVAPPVAAPAAAELPSTELPPTERPPAEPVEAPVAHVPAAPAHAPGRVTTQPIGASSRDRHEHAVRPVRVRTPSSSGIDLDSPLPPK
jgi:hypothetical protein